MASGSEKLFVLEGDAMNMMVLFRACALLQALVTIFCDLRYYTPYPPRWYVAYTHWCFVIVTLYFFASLFYGDMPLLYATALANTCCVNLSYWGYLYPKGKCKGMIKIDPVGTIKHGGSLLWLLGDCLLRGERLVTSGPSALAPVAFSLTYLGHMLFDHYFVVYPKWEPYGDVFSKMDKQLGFVLFPLVVFMLLSLLPEPPQNLLTSSLAFALLVLPGLDGIRRAYARASQATK